MILLVLELKTACPRNEPFNIKDLGSCPIPSDLKSYWNKKIISWESSRYGHFSFFKPQSQSVRARLNICSQTINKIASEKGTTSVLDLGCGTGVLLKHLTSSSIQYCGVDFSEKAIEKAQLGSSINSKFYARDVLTEDHFPEADVVVMLGLSDWLSKKDLQCVLQKIQSKDLLISYTQTGFGVKNHLYNLYRYLLDKGDINPVSYTDKEFFILFSEAKWKMHKDLTTKGMLPGRLLWLRKINSTF